MGTNPLSSSVNVELSGKVYNLVFDLNTYAVFEEVTGKFFLEAVSGLLQAFEEAGKTAKRGGKANGKDDAPDLSVFTLLKRVSMRDLRGLLYAAMRRHHKTLTLEQVGALVTHENIGQLVLAFVEGSRQSLPSAEEVKQAIGEGEADESPRPTVAELGGTPSGPLGAPEIV